MLQSMGSQRVELNNNDNVNEKELPTSHIFLGSSLFFVKHVLWKNLSFYLSFLEVIGIPAYVITVLHQLCKVLSHGYH